MGCCKKNTNQPKRRGRSCLTLFCRVLLFMILIINVVWGFGETLTAVVVNFIVNHPVGPDGFTNFNLEIKDITYIERKYWDVQEDAVLEPEVLEERNKIAKLREIITYNCTVYEEIRSTFDKQACNTANDQERKFDYYCAVVEHPEVYYEAFRPLVFNWLVYNCIFLFLIPIKLVSTCWTGQAFRLLGVYMILQIIPVGIAISIIYALFPFTISFKEESSLEEMEVNPLCALDYLHGYPVRVIYGISVAVRFGVKIIEAICVVWYIHTYKSEKRRMALGIPIRPNLRSSLGRGSKVSPIDEEDDEIADHIELEPIPESDVEAAMQMIQKEKEKEDQAKKAAEKKRLESTNINNTKPLTQQPKPLLDNTKSGTSIDTLPLPMDGMLPPVISPAVSTAEMPQKTNNPPKATTNTPTIKKQ